MQRAVKYCRERKGPALVHAKVIRPIHILYLMTNACTAPPKRLLEMQSTIQLSALARD
jgi:hypothetical protein